MLRGCCDATSTSTEAAAPGEPTATTHRALESFLETFRVGHLPCSVLAWIVVECAPVAATEAVLSAAVEEWEALVQRCAPRAGAGLVSSLGR